MIRELNILKGALQEEALEMSGRVERLSDFIKKGIPDTVHLELLKEQRKHMHEYCEVLRKRIEHVEKQINEEIND